MQSLEMSFSVKYFWNNEHVAFSNSVITVFTGILDHPFMTQESMTKYSSNSQLYHPQVCKAFISYQKTS